VTTLPPDAALRFIPTATLRAAYLHYADSRNPTAPTFVALEDDLELGIVDGACPEVACAVSSLLTRSLEAARCDLGGHLPVAVVRRVQREIISPDGVARLWGSFGHRFVLSRRVAEGRSGGHNEVLATILVGRRKGTIFFFTGRYNNVRHSVIDARRWTLRSSMTTGSIAGLIALRFPSRRCSSRGGITTSPTSW
jgi:hypothetical protein